MRILNQLNKTTLYSILLAKNKGRIMVHIPLVTAGANLASGYLCGCAQEASNKHKARSNFWFAFGTDLKIGGVALLAVYGAKYLLPPDHALWARLKPLRIDQASNHRRWLIGGLGTLVLAQPAKHLAIREAGLWNAARQEG